MNAYQEKFDKKYNDHYRGIIVKVDTTNKNGIYFVRCYPMHANISDDMLPPAFSTMTNISEHEPLQVGDLVWCYMENSNAQFPIIESRCGAKNQIPQASSGTEPDYFSDLTANSDLNESSISWDGEYNKVYSKDFGNNVHVAVNEDKEWILVKTDKGYFYFDANGDMHTNINNLFLTSQNAVNVAGKTLLFKIGNNVSITVDDTQTVDIKSNELEVKLDANTNKIMVTNGTINLKTAIDALIVSIENIVTQGSPVEHVVNTASQEALDLIKTSMFDQLLE
ncbi:MAG: hypothetical protein ABSG25_13830 [Bryobacteraceae bacterium]